MIPEEIKFGKVVKVVPASRLLAAIVLLLWSHDLHFQHSVIISQLILQFLIPSLT